MGKYARLLGWADMTTTGSERYSIAAKVSAGEEAEAAKAAFVQNKSMIGQAFNLLAS